MAEMLFWPEVRALSQPRTFAILPHAEPVHGEPRAFAVRGVQFVFRKRPSHEASRHFVQGFCPDSGSVGRATLVPDALRQAALFPCFWLRGITPRDWSVPPECTTPESAHNMGELIHADRIRTVDGTPLVIYGDGSGGAHTADWRYRRSGWACFFRI